MGVGGVDIPGMPGIAIAARSIIIVLVTIRPPP
jgi:hypothetical protein